MKTSLLILAFCATIFLASCDSTTETTAPPKLAGKGSVFTYSRTDFDADDNLVDTGTTTYTIDSANMTIETKNDMMRAVSMDDTIYFDYDDSGMHIYRPAVPIFQNFTLPAIWQDVKAEANTNSVTKGTYSAETIINGAPATVTGMDREQYVGTTVITLNGKTYNAFSKSFTVEVNVSVPSFGVEAKTTITVTYTFAPDLGFFMATSDLRTTDSEFSPIQPGRTELALKSYTIE